jgi:iron complex outermembrane receptor protein
MNGKSRQIVATLMRTLRNLALLWALFNPGFANAQSLDYSALEELFGEPVTASATGSPQRESQVPATMIIITAEDIRRSGARDIPGVLRHVPGLDLMQTSNDHAEINVRGFNQAFSPRLLVLVDGRQVYADYYGFTPWSTVPVELQAIRQIEIVKGPNSALFGFNAVGGVVNIVTYEPSVESVGVVALSGGSQGLKQVSAVSTWKPVESVGIRLSAGHREGDDFSTPLEPISEGLRRGNQRSSANVDLQWDPSDKLRMGIEATYSNAEQVEFSPVYTMDYGEYETQSVRAYAATDTRIGLLRASVYNNRITADVSNNSPPELWLGFDNRVTVAQLESISKIATAHTLRLSAEYRHNTMGTTPIPGGDVFYDVAALGGMWEWRIDPSLTLTTALRFDRWWLGRSGSLPAGYTLNNEDWNRTQTKPSFNTALVWQASDVDTLRLLVGRGVQLPNLLNLGALLFPVPPFGFVTGLPDLEPTIVENYEFSWDRQLPTLDAELRVNLFHGYSRNVVAISGGSRPSEGLFSIPINIGDSRTNGIEVSLEGTFRKEWRWGVSYKGQEIDDDFIPGVPVEIAVTDFENTTPRHVLKANLGWASGPWEVDGYLRYHSRSHGLLAGPTGPGSALLTRIPSYAAVDGRLAYALNERMTLALSGHDLTRSQQRQTAAPNVERTVFATVSMDFGSSR